MIDTLSFYILAVLGVFIETLPFLLLGALASGLMEVFFSDAELAELLPRRAVSQVLAGALIGLFFSVGAAGAAPLAQRLLRKGIPLPPVAAFWLAAPALNPIVLAATLVLLGPGPLLWERLALGYGMGAAIGTIVWIVSRSKPNRRERLNVVVERAARSTLHNNIQTLSVEIQSPDIGPKDVWKSKSSRVLTLAVHEMFDFAPYLLVGSLLAALPRAFLSQGSLLGGLLSGNALMDLFLVQGLAGSQSTLALLGVLVAGPLFGIQNLALALGAFRPSQSLPEGRGESSPSSYLPSFQGGAGGGYDPDQDGQGRSKSYRTFQALILALLGLFILWQAWDGEMASYVDGRVAPLVILAGLGCMILAQVVLNARKTASQPALEGSASGRRRWGLLALGMPVVLGLALNAYGGQEHLRPPALAGSGGAEIGGRGPLTLVFAQPMDPVSVEQRFQMEPGVKGRFTWVGNQMQFWPLTPLVPGEIYTVTLNTGSAAEDGRAIYTPSHWTVGVRPPWVVYLSPMNAGPELWRSRPDGSEPQQLSQTGGKVQDFGMSPDGEWIAYSAANALGGYDLWQVDRAGQNNLLLECGQDDCASPAIAPDGNRVAYVRSGKPQSLPQVHLFDRSTGVDASLARDPQSTDRDPSWSPDGRRLAYFDLLAGGIRVVDFTGGADTFIPAAVEGPISWSPDGQKLLYTDTQTPVGEGFVIVYEADFGTGVNKPVLKDNPNVVDYSTPEWSPDGEWVAVGVRMFGTLANRQVWRMRPDGSGAQPVTSEFSYSHAGFHWSPSGQALVFQRFELNSSAARPQVVVWQAGSGASMVIAEDAGFPVWEP